MDQERIGKIAKQVAADYESDQTPRVYVGTYAKYNNGDISGEWVDLDDFVDKDDFLEKCAEIHSDETDPEFMFQDYENFPSEYYGESGLKDEIWDYISKIKEPGVDKDIVDAVLENGGTLEQVDDVQFYPNAFSMTDVAEQYVDEIGGLEVLGQDTLERYFDHEAFGRDMEFDGTWVSVNGGMLFIP